MAGSTGRNDPCPCGSGRKYKNCCLDRTEGTTEGATSADLPADLTLVVDTPAGTMVRRIPAASLLRHDMSHGLAAEEATHDAAAVWGLPDFVYRAEPSRRSSGIREIGDGLVIVGQIGIVVQVKSREGQLGDDAKERRWLLKKAVAAARQGAGSIRQLRAETRLLNNRRGRSVEIKPAEIRWMVVVVLDHLAPPEGVVPEVSSSPPTCVLLRRDWEFLFNQLKSTYAVAQYFERVVGEPIALGTEPRRYYELALADAKAPPENLPAALVGSGHQVSTPLLPLAPTAQADRHAHSMVRIMLEDIALTKLIRTDERDRLRVLAELDRLPVGQRAGIGEFMLQAMTEVRRESANGGIAWKLRSVRGSAGSAHLGFGACSHQMTEELQGAFNYWVQLRHYDLLMVTNDTERLTTVGVLLTPPRSPHRPWDTTMSAISGDPGFTAADLRELRKLWPTPTG